MSRSTENTGSVASLYPLPEGVDEEMAKRFVHNIKKLVEYHLQRFPYTSKPPASKNIYYFSETMWHYKDHDGTEVWRYWNPKTQLLSEVRQEENQENNFQYTFAKVEQGGNAPDLNQQGFQVIGEELSLLDPVTESHRFEQRRKALNGEIDAMYQFADNAWQSQKAA